MKKIKMIGLDLDGTLLNSKKEVTDHTKSVLEEAIAQGIIVLVATGRPLTGIPGQVRANAVCADDQWGENLRFDP